MYRLIILGFCIFSTIALAESTAIKLVVGNQARAVVVTAQPPSPTTKYAAAELVHHLEQATGARLPITTEEAIPAEYEYHVYIGDTQAARQAGIEIDRLGPDSFVLKTAGPALIIAGAENPAADPLDPGTGLEPNPYGGPLFGVYELLQQKLGVRWLWPGRLGTYIPETDDLTIGPVDQVISPHFKYRVFRIDNITRTEDRWPRIDPATRRITGYSVDGYKQYARDLRVYYRRHRLGYSEPRLGSGHSATGVRWHLYGEDYPEWFGADAQGRRGFGDPISSRNIPSCVSNPELHRYIVEEAWDGGDWLPLGEVDSARYCQCPDCIAWDAPQDLEPGDRRYIVSDRYARFWQTIYNLAVERNPRVRVSVLIYVNYFPAPLQEIELNDRIYGSFCPWGWVRQDPEKQWLGWRQTGIQLAWRPNHWNYGYVMPMPGTIHGEPGTFFKFAYEHGMMAFDYDSLFGHWAMRGPELYLHMRWAANPGLAPRQALAEYYDSFGPAAKLVEDYFEYWENYEYPSGGGRPNFMRMRNVNIAFPASSFKPAKALLEAALELTRKTDPRPEYIERLEFLMAGMRHASLTSEFWATLENGHLIADSGEARKASRQALDKLLQFRRDHEHLYAADFRHATRSEMRHLEGLPSLEKELHDLTGLNHKISWRLNQGAGSRIIDDSGHYIGLFGPEGKLPSHQHPEWNQESEEIYLSFAGNQYIGVYDDPAGRLEFGPGESFHVSFRLRTSEAAFGNHPIMGVVGKYPGRRPDWRVGLLRDGGRVRFSARDDQGESITLESTSSVADGNWHDVEIIRDHEAGKFQISINGELEATMDDPLRGAVRDGYPMYIGRHHHHWGIYFTGDLAELSIGRAKTTE